MLTVSGLEKSFGGLRAVTELDFEVGSDEIFGLIGPNGSGKTTTINVLTGLYKPTGGSVKFMGQDITRRRPDELVKKGMSRTFQNLRLFDSMNVAENIWAAQTFTNPSSFSLLDAAIPGRDRSLREEADQLMERFALTDLRYARANSLSYGERKRLEMARALALKPRLLILDEPVAGMNPVEIDQMMEVMKDIRGSGISIILIEHHMKLVMNICDRIAVLNFGKKIAEGRAREIVENPAVVEAYLGKGHF